MKKKAEQIKGCMVQQPGVGGGREALLGRAGQPKQEAGEGREKSRVSGVPEAGLFAESQRNRSHCKLFSACCHLSPDLQNICCRHLMSEVLSEGKGNG